MTDRDLTKLRYIAGPKRPQTAVGALWRVLAALAVVLLVAGCAASPPKDAAGIGYWHDAQHHVSCWTFGVGGSGGAAISCLPDRDVVNP